MRKAEAKRIGQRNLRPEAEIDIKPHTTPRGSLTNSAHYMDSDPVPYRVNASCDPKPIKGRLFTSSFDFGSRNHTLTETVDTVSPRGVGLLEECTRVSKDTN